MYATDTDRISARIGNIINYVAYKFVFVTCKYRIFMYEYASNGQFTTTLHHSPDDCCSERRLRLRRP